MLRPGRIVIIDDDPTSRLKLAAAATALGHQAKTIVDGRSGLELLQREGADLILLDLVMPQPDGFEVLQTLKADPGLAQIPVLVISGVEDVADVARAISLGAEDVLPKSFAPVLLRARVGAALERRRLRQSEADYLAQVHRLGAAAQILEATDFDPTRLGIGRLGDRPDDLGRFARVFLGMADRIYLREAAYKAQIGFLLGLLLLIAFGAANGLQPTLSRLLGQTDVAPLGLAASSLVVSALVMGIAALFAGPWRPLKRSQILDLLIYALLACAIPRVLILFAATEVEAMTISLLLATEALIVYLVTTAIGSETRSPRRFAGLVAGFLGILLVLLLPPAGSDAGRSAWPLALALLAPAAYAGGKIVLALRAPAQEANPVTHAALTLAIAAAVAVTAALASGATVPAEIMLGDVGLLVAALGLVGAVGHLLLIVTVRVTGAVFASQSSYTAAASGVLWSVLLLGEEMRWTTWLALAVLFIGLGLVMPRRREADLETVFSAKPELAAARARLGI